jgi:hypothetical protein
LLQKAAVCSSSSWKVLKLWLAQQHTTTKAEALINSSGRLLTELLEGPEALAGTVQHSPAEVPLPLMVAALLRQQRLHKLTRLRVQQQQ